MDVVLKDLLLAGRAVLLRLVLVLLALGMIWLDIGEFHTQILELSFTEVVQELMLFACALLFWFAPAAPGRRGFNALAGGFFACLLMRELDGLFDPISHSAWCWPFLLVAVLSIRFACLHKHRQHTLADLAAFTRTPQFGGLCTGLAVLVFSRVFGMGDLWHLILQGGYARLAKTTVEEGIELLTYSVWLAASLEYYWGMRSLARVTDASVSSAAALVDNGHRGDANTGRI